jgi:putative SOS response-associated peptidase YedK
MWHALKGYKRCIIPAQGYVHHPPLESLAAFRDMLNMISYYEWHKRPSAKVAHFTRLPLGSKDTNVNPPLLFFAGLYDIVKYVSPVESRFQPSEDENDTREAYPTGNPLPLATFTILTTTPSKDIEWLHDRMPCILDKWEDVERWLGLGELETKGWEEGKGGTGELLKGFPGLEW